MHEMSDTLKESCVKKYHRMGIDIKKYHRMGIDTPAEESAGAFVFGRAELASTSSKRKD
jgi:hypothetical protein